MTTRCRTCQRYEGRIALAEVELERAARRASADLTPRTRADVDKRKDDLATTREFAADHETTCDA